MTDQAKSLADLLDAARLVAVLTIDRVDDAVPLARALVAGGVRTLEITLRTPAGADAAAAIRPGCRRPWWAWAPFSPDATWSLRNR